MTVCNAAFDTSHPLVLQSSRHAPSDLELGGSLQGVPAGHTRFVSYKTLLSLPQETFTVTDDSNFGKTVEITGVSLANLPAWLGAQPAAKMVIALCDDQYAAHYPAAYFKAHHPILVLKVNGAEPPHWPLGIDRLPMGPYMISHPNFSPAFHVLSHADEAQVPWGVVRLDFRREQTVYAPIEPQGLSAADPAVQQGYEIARQNCFRCHSRSGEGGQKSKLHWHDLEHEATAHPARFDAYVRHPKAFNPHSQMASSPQYDDATLHALRRYFASFAEVTR
jgi:mono/diheme cytochrome c family protein